MYTITKEFSFCASHQLTGLAENHPCMRLHGHNYKLKLEFKSDTLNPEGFVIDYRDLEWVKKYVDGELDHKHLNDVFPGMQTSVEVMSKILYDEFKETLPQLSAVELSETDKTNCRYEC